MKKFSGLSVSLILTPAIPLQEEDRWIKLTINCLNEKGITNISLFDLGKNKIMHSNKPNDVNLKDINGIRKIRKHDNERPI